jgi:hypothetical protein
MTEEWGPWIEHDGKGLPPGLFGQFVQAFAETTDGRTYSQAGIVRQPVKDEHRPWDWSYFGEISVWQLKFYSRVLRYRIRKPRSLTQLQDMIADIDVPEVVPA